MNYNSRILVPRNQLLGAAEVPDVPTYSIDELKRVRGWSFVGTTWQRDPALWDGDSYKPGGAQYSRSPFAWIDMPKNHLEWFGQRWRLINPDKRSTRPYKYEWKGQGLRFHDPNVYINTLKITTDPLKFIRLLKYAPMAGFNIDEGPVSLHGATRLITASEKFNGYYRYKLPEEVFSQWWMEVLVWHFLQTSFTMLRMAQIEDMYGLEHAYNNAGKFASELIAEMMSPETVTFSPYNLEHGGDRRIELELRWWQTEKLKAGINQVRHLIDENRKKMAARLIQLQNVDAEIVATEFAVDPLQNPYLVYDQAKSEAAGTPTFVNVARNASATWVPPDVTTAPENMQYWEQVPEFEAEHCASMDSTDRKQPIGCRGWRRGLRLLMQRPNSCRNVMHYVCTRML
jgi:hypothetical protein